VLQRALDLPAEFGVIFNDQDFHVFSAEMKYKTPHLFCCSKGLLALICINM